jgi:type I restriction enzyme S subunit
MKHYIPLGDVLESFDSGVWGDEDVEAGISVLRSTNFNADGTLDFTKLTFRVLDARDKSRKLLQAGDILLEKSGGGPKQPVGRVCLFLGDAVPHAFSNFIARLRPGKAVLSEYLFYYLWQFHRSGKTSHYQKQTTGIRNLEFKRYLTIPVPVYSIEEQQRIVDVLSRAEGIVRLRREAQQKTAELIPAIFIDMFGDPATNPKGWPVVKLGELLSSIDSGHSPKCGDRHRGVDEWGVLRLGAVSRCEYDEYEHKTLPRDIDPDTSIEVKSGDLLLSRKNTAELVGASAYVWATGGRILLPDLIFRLRLAETAQVNAIYLWKLLTTDAKRRALTRLATGSAGSMPNISKERLRTLPVKVPTLGLQMKFADFVKEIRSIRQQQQAAIQKAEEVFASLLAGAFSGI